MRTGTMGKVPAATDDLGFGQVFGSRDAFRSIRHVFSGARHGKALLGQVIRPGNLRDLLVPVTVNCLF